MAAGGFPQRCPVCPPDPVVKIVFVRADPRNSALA
jgi:hypothetical protein